MKHQQQSKHIETSYKQRGRRKLPWLMLLLGLVALCLVLFVYNACSQQSTLPPGPLQVLTRYCQALEAQDFTQAYAQLDSTLQQQQSLQDFTAQIQQLEQSHQKLSSCAADTSMHVDNASASGSITLHFADGTATKTGVVLREVGGKWGIRYFVQVAWMMRRGLAPLLSPLPLQYRSHTTSHAHTVSVSGWCRRGGSGAARR